MSEENFISDLKQTKIQNDLILKFAGEGIFGLDNQGIITFINPAGANMLGYQIEELIGQVQHNIVHHTKVDGSDYPLEECSVYKSFKENKTIKKADEIFWCKDGSFIQVEFTSTPIIEDNQTKGAVVIFRDVTADLEKDKKNQIERDEIIRNEVKRKNEKEYNKLKQSLYSAPAVVCIWRGPEHIYEFVNHEAIKTLGDRNFIGRTIREALPEIADQGFYEILDEVYQTGKSYIGKDMYSTIDRQGGKGTPEVVYWNFIYQPIFDENNNVIGINDFSWDVTEQVLARKKLEALAEELELKVQERTAELKEANKYTEIEREKLKSLFMNAPAGICILSGKEQRYVFANPDYFKIIGNKEIIGKTVREVFPELENQGIYEILNEVYTDGKHLNINELSIDINKKGNGVLERIYLNISYHPVFDINGQVEGVSVFAFDITEQVVSRKKIEDFAKSLEISNKELNNFAYVASHDLKAPIRTIANYAQLLERRYKEKLDEKASDYIKLIVNSSSRIHNLIDDLLEHAKISSEINQDSKTDLNEVISTVITELSLSIQENNGIVNYSDLPTLKVNQNHMIRLFQNLISNSLKYRSDINPIIEINAEQRNNEWLFSVKDNGIGIDVKYSDKVFEIFQRLHSNDQYEGTGIGLANCKKIVELNGGDIWLESEEGKGTTFYFTLPIN